MECGWLTVLVLVFIQCCLAGMALSPRTCHASPLYVSTMIIYDVLLSFQGSASATHNFPSFLQALKIIDTSANIRILIRMSQDPIITKGVPVGSGDNGILHTILHNLQLMRQLYRG